MLKQTRFLSRDGLTLHAEHWQPEHKTSTPLTTKPTALTQEISPQAPLVLLVHGFPDTPHSWYSVADQLVAAGYQVLMPWLRGYTTDSASRQASYDLIRCADDLAAWCHALGMPEAHLVGHDWGAVLAQLAAHSTMHSAVPITATHSPHITPPIHWQSISLLAIPALYPLLKSTNALPALPKQLALSRYMAHLQSAHSWRWVSADHAAWVEKIWQRWSPSWLFTPRDIAAARATLSQPEIAWAATRYYRALFTPWQASTRQVYRIISRRIQQPLLLLAGADDGCMHAEFHQRLAGGIARHGNSLAKHEAGSANSVVLDGLGHFLHAENPDLIAGHLLAFIAIHNSHTV